MKTPIKTCEGCAFLSLGKDPAPARCHYGTPLVSVVSHVDSVGIYNKGIPLAPCPQYPDPNAPAIETPTEFSEAEWLLDLCARIERAEGQD